MVKENITNDYLEELDKINASKERIDGIKRFIGLTRDFMFKSIMRKNPKLLEKFLIDLMNLDISDNDSIVFLDKELIKGYVKERGRVVDINVRFGDKYLIEIEVNSSSYKDVKERNDLYLERIDTLRNEINNQKESEFRTKYLYQLNLNTNELKTDKIGMRKMVEYDIINNIITSEKIVKYAMNLEYYYNLYYNENRDMSFSEIFMAGMMSKSYTELYNIFSKILSEKELNELIEDVIEMSNEELIYNIHYWEKDKMDALVEKNKEERLRAEAIESNKTEMIKNMLNKKIDYETISEISGKTTQEIKEIEKSMKEEK